MQRATFLMMVSSLLSNTLEQTWQEVNPQLDSSTCERLRHILEYTLLRTNRIGHARRAIDQAKQLQVMIDLPLIQLSLHKIEP